MLKVTPSLVHAVAEIDPLKLAILAICIIALAVVWLASVAIKTTSKRK